MTKEPIPRAARPRERRGLATAAWLLCTGLLVETISLGWAHPTAFLLFLGVGGLLVAAGILRYFLAIVPRSAAPAAKPDGTP